MGNPNAFKFPLEVKNVSKGQVTFGLIGSKIQLPAGKSIFIKDMKTFLPVQKQLEGLRAAKVLELGNAAPQPVTPADTEADLKAKDLQDKHETAPPAGHTEEVPPKEGEPGDVPGDQDESADAQAKQPPAKPNANKNQGKKK